MQRQAHRNEYHAQRGRLRQKIIPPSRTIIFYTLGAILYSSVVASAFYRCLARQVLTVNPNVVVFDFGCPGANFL
ncbi:MAG: hypothetical protein PHT15_06810 [Gallionellaceae bacterium]|nr:hypothetical protein [Gallionellaceae bacterium]